MTPHFIWAMQFPLETGPYRFALRVPLDSTGVIIPYHLLLNNSNTQICNFILLHPFLKLPDLHTALLQTIISHKGTFLNRLSEQCSNGEASHGLVMLC